MLVYTFEYGSNYQYTHAYKFSISGNNFNFTYFHRTSHRNTLIKIVNYTNNAVYYVGLRLSYYRIIIM